MYGNLTRFTWKILIFDIELMSETNLFVYPL